MSLHCLLKMLLPVGLDGGGLYFLDGMSTGDKRLAGATLLVMDSPEELERFSSSEAT